MSFEEIANCLANRVGVFDLFALKLGEIGNGLKTLDVSLELIKVKFPSFIQMPHFMKQTH